MIQEPSSLSRMGNHYRFELDETTDIIVSQTAGDGLCERRCRPCVGQRWAFRLAAATFMSGVVTAGHRRGGFTRFGYGGAC